VAAVIEQARKQKELSHEKAISRGRRSSSLPRIIIEGEPGGSSWAPTTVRAEIHDPVGIFDIQREKPCKRY
jgi:precorrin isomerase